MVIMSKPEPGARLNLQCEGKPDQDVEVGDLLTIGRSQSNRFMLDDHRASRRHAEIRLIAPGRYRLADLGSANGTWLNHRRLTAPCELQNGDLIQIGASTLRFECSAAAVAEASCSVGTATQLLEKYVIMLVTDIRNYTRMSEALPREKFSKFVKEWFKACGRLIEARQGTIDKFIGDAVMCYWLVPDPGNPEREVGSALTAAGELIGAAASFSDRLSGTFPGYAFHIGIGVSMGNALMGNVGTASNQSITLVGDCVNVAFRLESLTKEKNRAVIVTSNIAECAPAGYTFVDLGPAEVKGRKNPVAISSLELEPSRAARA